MAWLPVMSRRHSVVTGAEKNAIRRRQKAPESQPGAQPAPVGRNFFPARGCPETPDLAIQVEMDDEGPCS